MPRFRGDSIIATLTAVLRDDVQPIGERSPDVPAELEQIVAGCLKKDPTQRFQSMQDVQTALAVLNRQTDSGTLSGLAAQGVIAPPLRAQALRDPLIFGR